VLLDIKTLTELHIVNCKLKSTHLDYMRKELMAGTIKVLNLSGNILSQLTVLSDIIKDGMHLLRELNISRNRLAEK
jgi:hypothetical protein